LTRATAPYMAPRACSTRGRSHSPVVAGDLPRVEHALGAMYGAVARVKAASPERAAIRVSYAGDMPTGLAEYHTVLTDLIDVGIAGIALVLAAVVFYFLRVRAIVVMTVTILVGAYLTGIREQNRKRAALIEELTRTRAALERAGHEAGVHAERERLAHTKCAAAFTFEPDPAVDIPRQ